MGFSSTASHAIWLLAILVAAGTAIDFAFEHQERVDAAREARRAIDAERLLARFDGTFCYGGSKLVVEVTNNGTLPLNATAMSFVVDGQPLTGFAPDNQQADGSHIWLPEERVYFNRSGSITEPDGLVLFSERGAPHVLTKTTCRILTTITLTPASASMQIGDTQEFTAAGFDQFGDPIGVDAYAWSSAAGTIATLDADTVRLTAGTTSGAFTLTASAEGITGTANVTIHPGPPASVAVTPDPVNVGAGQTQQFTATVLDSYGNANSTATVTWSTNAGNITSGGLLTAQTTPASGRHVTATVGSLSDAATVNVVPGPVQTVTISPTSATLNTSTTRQFTAKAYDAYNNEITSATFAWSATRGNVSSSGLYTAPSTTGSATVTAAYDGVSASANVTVQKTVHVGSVALYKNGVLTSTFTRGETIEVRVVVRDHNNNLVQGVNVTVELVRPNGQLQTTLTDDTDPSGLASMSYLIPSNAQPGNGWIARVTGISGTNIVYNSAANVETQESFTVNS